MPAEASQLEGRFQAAGRRMGASIWMIEVSHTNPPCKHGRHDCDVCGTHDERDYPHTTIGGRGAVARIRRDR